MKKLVVALITIPCLLAGNAQGQEKILSPGESYTVSGDESYNRLQMGQGSTLTIPIGTSITLDERSLNDGGTIVLDGGSYTLNDRQDFGSSGLGGTLLANSGTFTILDEPNEDDPFSTGWKLPDTAPIGDQESRVIIDDAQVFVSPGMEVAFWRKALVTFEPGGDGFLDLEIVTPEGHEESNPWNPNWWLWASGQSSFEGYGLFAPEKETIQITTLPNGHTRVTSIFVLQSSGNIFTWTGSPIAEGSWSNSSGWKENGLATFNIPGIDDVDTGDSDEVVVLGGTVRVDTANQGAWSVDVQSTGTAVVSNNRRLRIAEDLTIENGGLVETKTGGQIDIENNLNISAGGQLTIDDAAVSVANEAAVLGTVAFTGVGAVPPNGGDFDNDGAVRGLDFLLWQQGGSPSPRSSADRGEWERNFGAAGSPLSRLTVDHGTLGSVELSSSGVIETEPLLGAGQTTAGQLTMQSDSRLVKQGSGTLYLDQSTAANTLAAGAQLSVEEGLLVAVNNAASNALDQGTTILDGGNLVLSSSHAAPAAFDSPIQVNQDASIVAAQDGSSAVAGATVTVGGNHDIQVGSGATGVLDTNDGYAIELAGDVKGSGRIDFGDGAVVDVQGSVTTTGVGFRGDTSQVTVAGQLAPGSTYYFNPTAANSDMTISLPISGARDVVIGDMDEADGAVGFQGGLAHTGVTRIERGALRLGGSDQTPAASPIEFNALSLNRGAVIESSEAAYNPTIGAAAGQITWAGAGGFASRQGGAGTTVAVNGGAALDWDSASNGFNGQALQLGSATANAPVILTNNLALGNAAERVIQVADNPDAAGDSARLTGVISSTGSASNLLRINAESGNSFQGGLLELLANNTFDNTLRIDGGAVYAAEGIGLPSDVHLQFSGNERAQETVFLTNGAFTRAIGAGAGQVSWTSDVPNVDSAEAGGFAARGGPLNVTLAGGTVLWDSANGLNGQDLHLGSRHADNVVTFNNDLDGQNDGRDIYVFDNPFTEADSVVINGDVNNADGLRFVGDGRVVFNGNLNNNSDELRTQVGNVVLVFNGNQTIAAGSEGGNIEARGDSMIFLNGTVEVGKNVEFQNNELGPSIGGNGRVNMFGGVDSKFRVEANVNLRPGADIQGVGTLEVDLGADPNDFAGGFFEMQPTSIFHLELDKSGNSVIHDSVAVESTSATGYLALQRTADVKWKIDVSALADLSGMISPSDEFDLFTLDSSVLLLDFDTDDFDIFDAPIVFSSGEIATAELLPSSDFDTSNATVRYQRASGLDRIYVTGLSYTGAAAAITQGAVPEPTAGVLGALALLLISARRSRLPGQVARFLV